MDTLLLILVYLIVSVLFIAIGVANWYRTKRFVERAHRTTGTVIELIERKTRRMRTYSPTVRFTTLDGRKVKFTEPLSTRPAGYEIDEQVTVLYDPEDPQQARVFKKSWRLYYYALLFGGLGVIFFFVYLIVFLIQGIPAL